MWAVLCLHVLVYGLRTILALLQTFTRLVTECPWQALPHHRHLTLLRRYSKRAAHLQVLVYGLRTILALLHPLTPFVTERLWQALPHQGPALISAPWPSTQAAADQQVLQHFEVRSLADDTHSAWLAAHRA